LDTAITAKSKITGLFISNVQIITHFLSPDQNPNSFAPDPLPAAGNATWQSSLETSHVWATATAHIDAGSDASCPSFGSIPCLLLQSIGNRRGQRAVSYWPTSRVSNA
jgi:hypothetical protein